MTLLSAWALGGLVLLAPLVIAHLRREQRPLYDVPSLLLWQDLEQRAGNQTRRLRRPRLPLLLALQALAVLLLVVALARPASPPAAPAATTIEVLDDSLWMAAPGRLAAAESRLERLAAALPGGTPVRLVLADGAPRVLYTGPPGGLERALQPVRAGAAPSSLPDAMAVAAGLITGPRDRVVVLRAPEDSLPALHAPAGRVTSLAIGEPIADQGIFSPSARCGIGGTARCEVLGVVANHSAAAVTDGYTALADGAALSGAVRIGPRASADIVLSARPGELVSLRLRTHDALTADDQAWVTVPSPANTPPSASVTLVGAPSDATAVARAFAAVPGIRLRLRTPASYRAADARASTLTVLDGWLPSGQLPPSPSVLLLDPPNLPGGRVGGSLRDGVVSGSDRDSDLLNGVDLTSLSISAGGGRALALPAYMTPIAWSPDGPLLAAGDDGARRVAVLSFDPAQSDLPQLASFPILAANLTRWSAGWAPAAATAGEAIRVDATPGASRLRVWRDGQAVVRRRLNAVPAALTLTSPGLYTVAESGPQVHRTASIAVNVAPPASLPAGSPPVDLNFAAGRAVASQGPGAVPWLLAAALLVLVLEWAYWRSRALRVVTA